MRSTARRMPTEGGLLRCLALKGPLSCHCGPDLARGTYCKRSPVREEDRAVLTKAAPAMFCSSLKGTLYLAHLFRGSPVGATACEDQYKDGHAH